MNEQRIIEPFLIRLKERIDSDPNLTAASLSVKAGLSNAAIRHWLNGDSKSPTIESARKVCAALGTTLEEFMSEARTPEEKEIVRLALQLPAPLLRELLGYGRGLAAAAGQTQPQEPEEKE
ncbi:helix-turn-helix domain-containing protein [Albibacillus kandeliae]|uniref:helix-turn-helix domain-containing protein n=1 Tax=Albibacillus kandeliae TaxID=2174228 RepID=UPI000D69B3F6|nr:helix-turn-helix transcriptional regulator [Albibacillus kandeliae]